MGPGFGETIWFSYPGFPPILSLRYGTQGPDRLRYDVNSKSYEAVLMLEIWSKLQRWFDKQSAHGKMEILAAIEEARQSGYRPPNCSEECMEDDG